MTEAAECEPESAVGALLRASRLRCGEEIGDVAQTLRIRRGYLEALEEGRFQDLPGATYAVGFVRSYAELLGLDGDEVVRRFKAEAAGISRTTELVFPSPVPEGGIPGGALLLVGVLMAGLAYGGWYVVSTQDQPVAELVPALPDRLTDLVNRFQSGFEPTPGTIDAEPAADTPAAVVEPKPEPAPPAVVTAAVPVSPSPDTTAEAPVGGLSPSAPPPAPAATTTTSAPSAPEPAVTESTVTESPVTESTGTESTGTEPATVDRVPPAAPDLPASAPAVPHTMQTAAGDQLPPVTETPPAAPPPAPEVSAATPPQPAASASRDPAPAPPANPTSPSSARAGEALAAVPALPADPVQPGDAAEPESAAALVGTTGGADSRIVVRATTDSWIQVRDAIGNELLLTRLMRAGDTYDVPDRPGLKLLTGNAGGLEFVVDGKKAPPIGPVGAVRRDITLDADDLLAGPAVQQ